MVKLPVCFVLGSVLCPSCATAPAAACNIRYPPCGQQRPRWSLTVHTTSLPFTSYPNTLFSPLLTFFSAFCCLIFFCFLLSVSSSSHMMYCYVSHFCKLSVFVSVPQSSLAAIQRCVLQCRAKAQSYQNKQIVRFEQILRPLNYLESYVFGSVVRRLLFSRSCHPKWLMVHVWQGKFSRSNLMLCAMVQRR